ncbi:hypothetical protein Hdeb2414_s0108g00797321 [Helianthus debilis subsp. tardiflorus]
MKIAFRLFLHFSLLVFAYGYDSLENAVKSTRSRGSVLNHVSNEDYLAEYSISQVYMGPQEGLKDADKISSLPGCGSIQRPSLKISANSATFCKSCTKC